MIKTKENSEELDGSLLEVGDRFCFVGGKKFFKGIFLVEYTVEKVLKRDIVAKARNGTRIRWNRHFGKANLYAPDSERVRLAKEEIQILRNYDIKKCSIE